MVLMRRHLIRLMFVFGMVWAGHACAGEKAEPGDLSVALAPPGVQPAFEVVDLPSTYVLEIVGDRHGFVWIAGDRGVHRFDGRNFFNLDRDPSRPDTLESRFVYLLAESSDAMWIGSPNGSLQRLDSRTGELVKITVEDRGISPQGALWIACDAQGRLWQMSDLGLLRLDRSGKTVRVMERSFDAMAFNPGRTELFVALPDRRVLAIDAREPDRISTLLTLPNDAQGPITAMTSDSTGLWLVAGRELWRFDSSTRSLKRIWMPAPFVRATSIATAKDGSLWFGSVFDEGLLRLDPEQRVLSVFRNDPNDPQSLAPAPINALAVDQANNLWVGQGTSGLRRLRLGQAAVSRYSPNSSQGVCAISETDGNRVIAAPCRGGGLMELERKTGLLEPVRGSSILPSSSRALVGDGSGGLWITSTREGLFHWQSDGKVSRYALSLKAGTPSPTMTGAFMDAQRRVWVTHLSGFAVLDPDAHELRNVEAYEGENPFVFDLTQDVSPGPNDSLWIGTMKGVLNFHPETGQIRRYQHDPDDNGSLSDNYVLQTYTDKAGRLWVGTRAGLNRLTIDGAGRTVFRRYGLGDGLPDITIEAIVGDAQGVLWIGTGHGIARWDPKEDRFQSYLAADGMPDTGINMKSATLGSDGSLYFGTLNGMWRIDPQAIRIAAPTPVVLSSHEAGDRVAVNFRGKALSAVKADYTDGRVVFRIAVLGDARRLSYRLEGLEDTWRDMPDDLSISYHWLSPGSYRLQVRQLQRDGNWGAPELSLPVEIAPPLWRTAWAYALYSIMAIALLIVLLRTFIFWKHRALREQLKESHARLSVALHAARFGMWAWDVDTDQTELDEHAKKLLSAATSAQPMTSIFDRMHPDDIAGVQEKIDTAITNNVAVDFEFRFSGEDSETRPRWIEGHAAPYSRPGKATYLIGVNRDATRRKDELLELEHSRRTAEEALEELKRSRLDLALALESGDLGVWRLEMTSGTPTDASMWTRDLPIDCDANVRRIFGWPNTGDITRGRCLRAVHAVDRRRMLSQILHALSKGSGYSDRYRIMRPDGQIRSITIRAASTLQSTGATSLIGIINDVTEEEALKDELRRSAHEAELATEAKGRFLAMMSHEIRTPINGVVGMVELLLDTSVNEQQQRLLRVCKDSACMLVAIINDILDFSKIEAGKLDLEYAPLSPRMLVESVAESLRGEVVKKGIDLDVFVAHDVPIRLIGDRVRLSQILANLIGNAIKFTENGGVRVYVSLLGTSDGNHHLIRFDIVDTGIGIDSDALERLFRPFEQADAATTRRFGGTGLGLTIVKHLIDLMKGKIECDSAIASGSRFSVTLPLDSAIAKTSGNPHTPLPVHLVTLCESRDRASMFHELASYLGASIEIAPSLIGLLKRLDQAKDIEKIHNLALIDKGFAEDSEAICNAIRQHATGAPTPIVVVRSDTQWPTEIIADGVAVVAGNPLTAPNLARGIHMALGLSSPETHVYAESSIGAIAGTPVAGDPKILIADDNATNREVIARQLMRLGHACDVAKDGEEAWEKLKENPIHYQLLLTDCHMPKLDGYGLTERIRREETKLGFPRLNIVAITANALAGEAERCLAMGMDGFLAKPVQMLDLKRVLAHMLPSDGTQSASLDKAITSATPGTNFVELAQLLDNDFAKLQHILEVFLAGTHMDLEQWIEARRSSDRRVLRELAHKLKSGCRQLGEMSAAFAFDTLEQHRGDAGEFDRLADTAHRELELVLEHVRAFLNGSPSQAPLSGAHQGKS
jgi:signal transduction histidine kinase/ligand-binding sensor domain-containing protein/CheY-like chemotaxis protein